MSACYVCRASAPKDASRQCLFLLEELRGASPRIHRMMRKGSRRHCRDQPPFHTFPLAKLSQGRAPQPSPLVHWLRKEANHSLRVRACTHMHLLIDCAAGLVGPDTHITLYLMQPFTTTCCTHTLRCYRMLRGNPAVTIPFELLVTTLSVGATCVRAAIFEVARLETPGRPSSEDRRFEASRRIDENGG